MKQYKGLLADYIKARDEFLQEKNESEEMEAGYTPSFIES